MHGDCAVVVLTPVYDTRQAGAQARPEHLLSSCESSSMGRSSLGRRGMLALFAFMAPVLMLLGESTTVCSGAVCLFDLLCRKAAFGPCATTSHRSIQRSHDVVLARMVVLELKTMTFCSSADVRLAVVCSVTVSQTVSCAHYMCCSTHLTHTPLVHLHFISPCTTACVCCDTSCTRRVGHGSTVSSRFAVLCPDPWS